jgi:hypothetical protein
VGVNSDLGLGASRGWWVTALRDECVKNISKGKQFYGLGIEGSRGGGPGSGDCQNVFESVCRRASVHDIIW